MNAEGFSNIFKLPRALGPVAQYPARLLQRFYDAHEDMPTWHLRDQTKRLAQRELYEPFESGMQRASQNFCNVLLF